VAGITDLVELTQEMKKLTKGIVKVITRRIEKRS
jgi:hypothetical protein